MSTSQQPHDDNHPRPPSPSDSPPRPGQAGAPRNATLWPLLLLGFCLLAGGTIWYVQRPQFFDHQIGNIVTLIAGFAVLVAGMAWFCTLRGVPLAVRMAVPALAVASVALFFVFFRIEYVTGELVPVFSYRFAPPADSRLEPPKPAAAAAADLSTTTAYDFPQFLGPDRDMTYDAVELAADWGANPPQLLWRQPLGAAWSGFAAVGGFAVTLEQRGELELVTCYEIETGKLCWSHSHRWRHETLMGGIGPRSTPTIDRGDVFAQGAGGMLFCLDGATGEPRWQRDLLEEFKTTAEDDAKLVAWGRAGSPLVVDDLVIVPAGGAAGAAVSLAAFDRATGEPRWQGGGSQISYSSPAVATLGGVRQVLIVNESSVAGHDLQTGQQLWQHDWPGSSSANASVSQAVALPGDRVLVSKHYGEGAALLEISREGEQWTAKQLWTEASLLKTKFTNVAVSGKYAYALSDGILECVDLSEGERMWKKGRYGHGQILLVGDKLLVLAETGEVHLLQVSPRGPIEQGEVEAISGKSWNTLCLYGPYLLVRNGTEAACLRLPLAESNR